ADAHVLVYAELREDGGDLVRARDAAVRELVLRHSRQVATLEYDAAGARLDGTREHIEECALAGTVGADHGSDAVAAEGGRDAFECDEAVEALADTFDGQERCGAHRSPHPTIEPQMPLGRNSTNKMKIAPTKSCQFAVQSDSTSSMTRKASAPT